LSVAELYSDTEHSCAAFYVDVIRGVGKRCCFQLRNHLVEQSCKLH